MRALFRRPFRRSCSALLAIAALLLSGCAASVRSDISAINKLPADLQGKTFFVAPRKEQESSLEFSHYAELVGAELQAKGLRPAPAASADWLVFLRYAFDQQTELIPTPAFGPTGSLIGGGSSVMVNGQMVFIPTYSNPLYGFTGTTVMPATVNRRSLSLDVVERNSTPEKPNKLYEATVFSEGFSGILLQVMPTMIKALFTQWPGPPVRTETLTLPLPSKPR
ncbi:MAG: hypothetical protein JWN73_1243 [Betaproteobacteria bacterium]|nr:hypothetical protein [Betaproteobacteria bacterium]